MLLLSAKGYSSRPAVECGIACSWSPCQPLRPPEPVEKKLAGDWNLCPEPGRRDWDDVIIRERTDFSGHDRVPIVTTG